MYLNCYNNEGRQLDRLQETLHCTVKPAEAKFQIMGYKAHQDLEGQKLREVPLVK